MQQMPPTPGHTPRPNTMVQAQKIVIITIALFATAGLLVGFTVGRVTKPTQTAQTPIAQHPNVTATTAITPTIAATATVDVSKVRIGCPDLKYPLQQNADGATSYTVSAQVKDKTIESKSACGAGNPLYAPNITCKIWLTQDADSIDTLQKTSLDMLKSANFQAPFPKEEPNAFLFEDATPQVQQCSQTGTTIWNYKLSPTLKTGTYYLGVITDWKGTLFNWSYKLVTIKGQ